MKKRTYSASDRTVKNSHLILVTVKEGDLPEFFNIYGKVMKLKVKPFVEPVKQLYYNAFGLGISRNSAKDTKSVLFMVEHFIEHA